MPRLMDRDREGLFYNDVTIAAHRRFCERYVRVIGTRNDDEVDIITGYQGFRIRDDLSFRESSQYICRPARCDCSDPVAIGRADERHVKSLRGVAEANQADLNFRVSDHPLKSGTPA